MVCSCTRRYNPIHKEEEEKEHSKLLSFVFFTEDRPDKYKQTIKIWRKEIKYLQERVTKKIVHKSYPWCKMPTFQERRLKVLRIKLIQ